MLGLIKKQLLKQKQNIINKKFPAVNMVLHPDMPVAAINKMVELAKIVNVVNSLEPKISVLSEIQYDKRQKSLRNRF
jgi:hypothetical protein